MPAVTAEDHGELALDGLSVQRPDGRPWSATWTCVFCRAGAADQGPSGSGKTTLLRALAGLWPCAQGRLRRRWARALFLSQRPYLPLGELRGAVAYPGLAGPQDDARLADAMERVNLGHLAPRLGEAADWSRVLSIGEQQRLAFARVLYNRPAIVFLDEATSATDEGLEHALYRRLRADLPGDAGQRGASRTLDAFHSHRLELDGTGRWSMGPMEETPRREAA